MQQPMINPKDIFDPTTAINMALVLMAKAFKLNYSTSTNNNQIISSNLCKRRIAQQVGIKGQDNRSICTRGHGGLRLDIMRARYVGNQNRYNAVQNARKQIIQNAVQNSAAQGKVNGNGNKRNQVRCYNYKGMGHLARNCTVRPRRRDAAYLQTQLLKRKLF
ncbi:hypothetical protein Tco_1287880 [Tanacetum coccineum]